MKSVLLSFFLLLLIVPLQAQPRPANLEIPITVYDNSGLPNNSVTLYFGLDSTATDSIDNHLGEMWLWCFDCPPVDLFVAVFDLPVISVSQEWASYKDFRHGVLPYTGIKEHIIAFRRYSAATALYFSWNFPPGVSGVLKDNINGAFWNYQMPPSGTYTNPNFVLPFIYNTKLIITYNSVIPVELESFKGIFNGGSVILNWITASELNNLGFEIQRKNEHSDWKNIGFVNGNGTTTQRQDYTFYDNDILSASGTLFYRLKQLDLDGNFSYSETITVDVNTLQEVLLKQNFPNPFNPITNIEFSIPQDLFVNISIYNAAGERMDVILNEMLSGGVHTIPFNAYGLSSGIYFYVLNAGGNILQGKMTVLK